MSCKLDEVDLIEETVTWVDGPMEGFAKGRRGEYYAFRRCPVIAGVLFHWVLIPVESTAIDVSAVFRATRAQPPPSWISVIEDARTDTHATYEATLGSKVPVPLDWD